MNTDNARDLIGKGLCWAIYFSMITLLWIGLEVVIEGRAHSSAVDTIIAAIWAAYTTHNEWRRTEGQ